MDNPKPRELTKDEVENATDLLNDAVQKYIATKPESEQKQIFSGADIAKANPRAACKFGRTTYDAVYNMENKIDRALVISNLLND